MANTLRRNAPRSALVRLARLLCAAGVGMSATVCLAQTGFFDKITNAARSAASAVQSGTTNAVTPEPSSPTPTPAAKSGVAAASASLGRLEPRAEAQNELIPDAQCKQVVERFDVFEKATDYAGTAAQLRLQTLVASDFQQSQLSDSDRKLLRYLAYTTIWIPSSVELAVGTVWSTMSSKGSDAAERTGRSQRAALKRQSERLQEVQKTMENFPGDSHVLLDDDLRDGALSRVGGMVVVSPRFLSLMDEQDGVRDVLLAHELSHLYKRHSLKALQYELISSVKGWNIAKKLLRSSMPKSGISAIYGNVKMYVETAETANEIREFIRDTQIRYSIDQEFEADACAVRLLPALQMEPRAAWALFAGVLQDPGPSPDTSYASLHPSPQARTDNIRRAMAAAPRTPPSTPGGARPAPPAPSRLPK